MRDGRLVGTRDIAGLTQRELARLMIGHELPSKVPSAAGADATPAVLRLSGPGIGDVAVHQGEILGLAGGKLKIKIGPPRPAFQWSKSRR